MMRLLLVFLVVATGCAPLAGSGRARTLGKGRTEVGLGPEVTLVAPQLATGAVPLPSAQLALGVQHGAGERLDLGGRVWAFSLGKLILETAGAALDGKLQLRRGDEAGGGADIALAASVAYHRVALGGTPEHQVGVTVPLLFGFKAGKASQFVIGPRVAYQLWTGESQHPLHVPLVGGSAGFVWQFSSRWYFAPELVWLWSPLSFNGESESERKHGLNVVSLGLGVGYGW